MLIGSHAGDFLYSDLECETMLRNIEFCTNVGCGGGLLGVLDADGHVNLPRRRSLIAAEGPMGVTFHRAFDLASFPHRYWKTSSCSTASVC